MHGEVLALQQQCIHLCARVCLGFLPGPATRSSWLTTSSIAHAGCVCQLDSACLLQGSCANWKAHKTKLSLMPA